jgi:DNA-binding HxlR family transcriptional regulator
MVYRSGCPMCNALDIVGDKWSLIVIRDLLGGKTTFKEFMNGPEKIASNILSQRLKWLKNHEILDFRYRKDNKKEKCYYLTNKGIDLYPVMSELMLWSAKNVNNEFNDRGKDVIKKLKNDKQARIEEVTQNYKKIKSKLQIS